jgi:hypothetical protein
MSLQQPGKVQAFVQILGAISAILVAVFALFAYVWSTPLDMNNWARCTFAGYSVHIDSPVDGDPVDSIITISGTATIPDDWTLVILVQTPAELRYYIAGNGAIKIVKNEWQLNDVQLGASDVKLHQEDLQHVFKIVAVVLDAPGQEQVEAALTKKADGGWLSVLPHNAARDIRAVTLRS